MKQVFPVLMLIMLCIGLFTFAIKIQPARADGPLPLSVAITPQYVVMSGGQSQLFNASVTGGSPPYTYQWFSGGEISHETNPTYDFTAPFYAGAPYSVTLAVTDRAGTRSLQSSWVWEPSYDSPIYFSVEPIPTAPLTNVNASINGLETPPTSSLVGENFTVEIHLRNATATNVPAGVDGVEVHFYFGNILNYCKPIGFTDELGQSGSALNAPVIYAIAAGFYDNNWINTKALVTPPYTNATQYIVAAATTIAAGNKVAKPWNGNDGLVAKITFQITGQPSQNMSQPDFYAQLQIGFGQAVDINYYDVALSVAQGTLHIDSAGALSTVGDLNGDGRVGLDDLVLFASAYNSKPGDPYWNALADIAPPYGIISLTDLVTLAMHYGQHNP